MEEGSSRLIDCTYILHLVLSTGLYSKMVAIREYLNSWGMYINTYSFVSWLIAADFIYQGVILGAYENGFSVCGKSIAVIDKLYIYL